MKNNTSEGEDWGACRGPEPEWQNRLFSLIMCTNIRILRECDMIRLDDRSKVKR